jgi:membrane protein YdbS with pleckstrin-like domain
MYRSLRNWALALLKVPPEPHAPIGDPASLRVFNAGRNYFRLRMVGWAFGQALALAGFIFWTAVLLEVEKTVRTSKVEGDTPAPAASVTKRGEDNWPRRAGQRIGRATVEVVKGRKTHTRVHPWDGFKQMCVELALLLPSGAFLVIWAVKIFTFVIYVGQLGLTYAIRRLDFEMRWYMVTDRSLRLRSGVWRVSEATMSFANIQQVVVSQGPLQRLLGLADVKVKSAGGGGGGHHHHEGSDMHTGLFHSVTNAEEIRDLMLERLRRFREAGLGDPEEKTSVEPVMPSNHHSVSADAFIAARELVAEARALRTVMERS